MLRGIIFAVPLSTLCKCVCIKCCMRRMDLHTIANLAVCSIDVLMLLYSYF
jgi:hypothetical protein